MKIVLLLVAGFFLAAALAFYLETRDEKTERDRERDGKRQPTTKEE